jgi:hypothetical protein
MFSEEEMQRRFGPAVEGVVKFFQWTPNWLLVLVGLSCWAWAVYVMVIRFHQMTTTQQMTAIVPAMVGLICGMAYMIKARS